METAEHTIALTEEVGAVSMSPSTSLLADPFFERDFIAFVCMACDGLDYEAACAVANTELAEYRHTANTPRQHLARSDNMLDAIVRQGGSDGV